MTINGSRQTAVAVASIGAGLSVFLAVIALLIGVPQLLFGVLILVAIFGLSAAFLALPVSLSLEGDDVIYRSGRSQERYPRSEVARCALAQSGSSAGWVFSNQAGARLFAINAWRFQDTDVFAFCARAGITWDGPSMRPVDRLSRDIRSAGWSLGIGLVAGGVFLASAGLSAWSQSTARDDMARYRIAPPCSQAAGGGPSCRLETQARVTSVDAGNYNATIHVTLVPGGGDYRTRLTLPSPRVGDVVAVELWSGRVTLVAERDTTDNPADNPNLNINGVVAGFALFALGSFGLAFFGWNSLSRSRKRMRAARQG
ncbi:MAG TPA: hypothetical protein VGV88_07785 [Candidatus Dormibacteraeota bacterium]|nr:hypothetical protein [Candidatus Dormibacteraeota bacterium]